MQQEWVLVGGRETWSWTIPLAPTLDIRLARSHSSKDLITQWLAGGDIFLYWKLDSQKKKKCNKRLFMWQCGKKIQSTITPFFLFHCPRARLFKHLFLKCRCEPATTSLHGGGDETHAAHILTHQQAPEDSWTMVSRHFPPQVLTLVDTSEGYYREPRVYVTLKAH